MPKVIQVIESEISRGEDASRRTVRQYHAPDGKFLAEIDPGPPFADNSEERKQMLTLLDTAKKFDEYKLKEGLKTFGMKPKAAAAMLKSGPVKQARKLLRKRRKHAHKIHR